MIKPNNVFIVNIQKYLQNYAKEETVMGILAYHYRIGFCHKKSYCLHLYGHYYVVCVFPSQKKNTVFVASVLQLYLLLLLCIPLQKQCKYINKNIIMSHDMRFPSMWYVRPAKPQTSLRIRAV